MYAGGLSTPVRSSGAACWLAAGPITAVVVAASTRVPTSAEERSSPAGRQERDHAQRFAIYEQLQESAARDVPVLALYHERAPYACKTGLAELHQRANFQPTLDQARWS
jgi:hypothetical protein